MKKRLIPRKFLTLNRNIHSLLLGFLGCFFYFFLKKSIAMHQSPRCNLKNRSNQSRQRFLRKQALNNCTVQITFSQQTLDISVSFTWHQGRV